MLGRTNALASALARRHKTQSTFLRLAVGVNHGLASAPRHNSSLAATAQKLAPGLAVAFATSQVGFAVAHELGMALLRYQGLAVDASTQSPISGIPVSILLGLAINNAVLEKKTAWSDPLKPGLQAATKPVLQLGIVCVGAKLSAVDLVTTGLVVIPCVAASVGAGLTFIPWIGNKLGLSPKMSSLIAAGTSICGVTAVTAVAPAIKADSKDASFAIANVVAFGTLGMLTMPYIAHAALVGSQPIGIFLGLSVHDTSQVLGSALTYASVYGDEAVVRTAAVTKLTRNLLLAGVVPYMSVKFAAQEGAEGAAKQPVLSLAQLKKYTPSFVLGFVGMSLLRTAGDVTLAETGRALFLLDGSSWKSLHGFVGGPLGTQYLLGTALAGVGLTTKLSALKGVGPAPFLVGFSGACVVSGTGMLSAQLISLLTR